MCCLLAEWAERRGRSPPAQAGQAGGIHCRLCGPPVHVLVFQPVQPSKRGSRLVALQPIDSAGDQRGSSTAWAAESTRHARLARRAVQTSQLVLLCSDSAEFRACLCWAEGAHLSLTQPGVLPSRLLLCTRVGPAGGEACSGQATPPVTALSPSDPSSGGSCMQQNQLCPPDRHSKYRTCTRAGCACSLPGTTHTTCGTREATPKPGSSPAQQVG